MVNRPRLWLTGCSLTITLLLPPMAIAQNTLFAPLPTRSVPVAPEPIESEATESSATATNPTQPGSTPASIPSESPVVSNLEAATDLEAAPNDDGRYVVNMPVTPQFATRTTPVAGGLLTWNLAIAEQAEGIYAVAYTDLPLDLLASGQTIVSEGLQDRPLLEEFGWQAISQPGQPISQGNIRGLEFLYFADSRLSALRLYLANRRLYAVMAVSPELTQVSQFMESFRLDSLWQSFVSEAGRFRVDVTMAPVVTTQSSEYQGDRLDWQQFTIYNLMAPADAYQIAYTDLPAGLAAEAAEAMLSNIATSILADLDAEALAGSASTIALQRYPGREYTATTPAGKSYVLRFYLTDERLYGVLAGSQSLENLDHFLSSFRID
ncbi:MAG: hypothetical protein ACFB0G_19635 [Leptolyngbyaceae cyanobacterium]